MLHGSEMAAIQGGTATEVFTNGQLSATAGQVGFVDVAKTPVTPSNQNAQLYPDCAYSNGYMVYAWQQAVPGGATNGIYCTVIEEATGAHLVDSYQLATGSTVRTVRLVGTESGFYAFWTKIGRAHV